MGFHHSGDGRCGTAHVVEELHIVPLATPTALAGRTRAFGGVFTDAFFGRSRQFTMTTLGSHQKSEVTDPPEARGNQMIRKAPEERSSSQGHLLDLVAILVVLPFESDRPLLLIDPLDALIANGDAAGVARQIADHGTGVAQGGAAEDIPIAGREVEPPGAPGFDSGQRIRPADILPAIQILDPSQQDRPEDHGHVANRKQIVVTRLPPFSRVAILAPCADEHMQVRMPIERPAPSVKHGEETSVHPPIVLLEKLQGFRRSAEQLRGKDVVVEFEYLMQLLGHGEDHMEMRAIRQTIAHLLRPFRLAGTEAIGAMAVATGAGIPFGVMARLALGLIVTESPDPALCQQVEFGVLFLLQTSRPEVAPLTQNIVDGCLDRCLPEHASPTVQG